ncbi:MAG: hypothetical protein RSC44_02420 [Clostridia bacterium]
MQRFCGSTLIDDYFNTDGKYKKVSKKVSKKVYQKRRKVCKKKTGRCLTQ